MKDSILKGTGNSRFLKSAVPAGTSWADALAMLQAGTFPIDFNGINTEGFQQVGTPLNKANLLKDATAGLIGLPPSTTPDEMFRALGNTGELHVWRKTTKNAADVPAGYNLGAVQNVTKYPITDVRSYSSNTVVKAYNKVNVDDAGNVTVDASDYVNFYEDSSCTTMLGKFIQVHSSDPILFIPSDASVTFESTRVGSAYVENYYTNKYQIVTGYPLTPAGTTTTYPVSTNPNAYQEGDDAKPAGYTLGEVVTGLFKMGPTNSSTGYYYGIANSITVNDGGTIPDLTNTFKVSKNISSSDLKSTIAGKFVQLLSYEGTGNSGPGAYPFKTIPGPIVFIPANVNCGISEYRHYIDRYQPVTGYAAIPANTTIEYLGELGDKARVQVVSYVGTGTYGPKHPTTVAFDIVPKIVFIAENVKYQPKIMTIVPSTLGAFGAYLSGSNVYGLISPDVTITGKRISFFSATSSKYQMNDTGNKYFAIAIG